MKTQASNFRIKNLYVSNIKRIRCVDITPDKDVVILEGRNAQGKSSILDAIEYALCGKSSLPPKPVRDGADTAEIRIDIGDFVVTRTWSKTGNSYLKVESKQGAEPVQSPQAWLDNIIGKLSFDPYGFVQMNPTERLAELKAVTGLDFSEEEKKYNDAYAERTLINRDISSKDAELKGYASLPETKKLRAIDEVQADINKVEADNSKQKELLDKISEAKAKVTRTEDKHASAVKDIAELDAKIKTLKDILNDVYVPELKSAKDALAKLGKVSVDIVSTEPLRQEMKEIAEAAGLVAKHERRAQLKRETDMLKDQLRVVEKIMEKQKEVKAEKLKNADYPVAGLSIERDDVHFNSQPFAQLSDAQKISISMAIAVKQNPGLKFVKIQNGSLLDKDSMAKIEAFAKENDFQVWIERVADEPSAGAVYIEDGEIKTNSEDKVK